MTNTSVFSVTSGVLDAYLSVSELNQKVAFLLERSLPLVSVTGEISNFTRAASGHLYFAIKDHSAQVRCVMFRGKASSLDFSPREGDKVQLRAVASFYQARGEFQLTVEQLRKAGAGGLYEQFLALKAKLLAQGLFEQSRKRPIPVQVKSLGLVTSLQAAALKDVLASIARRAPHVAVIIYPCAVQGKDAPREIATAINLASHRALAMGESEVILVVRGGGSIEDLWAYNSEIVANAIALASVPVISGVGHETDTTIADFVADLRAPTPTAAAELASPDRYALMENIDGAAARLTMLATRSIRRAQQMLDISTSRLQSPSRQWQLRVQAVEQNANRLAQSASNRARFYRLSLDSLDRRFKFPSLQSKNLNINHLENRLQSVMRKQIDAHTNTLASAAQALDLLGPPAVLARGYAIVRTAQGNVVRKASQVAQGDVLEILLDEAQIKAVVR
jgi:exodeoxyribonuclease VII large subunit